MIKRRENLVSMDPIETVEVYNRIMNRAPFGFLAKRISKLGITEGKLLDIACGPGQLLVALARQMPGLQLHGLDISPNMLDACHRNLRKKGLEDEVQLHEGSAYELPFPPGAFDLVVATVCLHFMDDADRFFQQIRRALRPGGIGYIYAFRRDAPALILQLGRLNTLWRAWRYESVEGFGHVIEASYTPMEIENRLEKLSPGMFEIKSALATMTILLNN